jgi:hypothetical protein
MSYIDFRKIIAGAVLALALLILIFTDYGNQPKVYDCSLAEWHPDIPTQVKEECRKMRLEEQHRSRQIEKKTITT